jgi:hypothetical protein
MDADEEAVGEIGGGVSKKAVSSSCSENQSAGKFFCGFFEGHQGLPFFPGCSVDESVDEAGFHLGKVRKIEDKPGGGSDGDGRFCSQGFERRQGIGLGEVKMKLECVIAFGNYEVGDEELVSGLALLFVEGEGEGQLGVRAFGEDAQDEGGI